jgi:hypothetical protein
METVVLVGRQPGGAVQRDPRPPGPALGSDQGDVDRACRRARELEAVDARRGLVAEDRPGAVREDRGQFGRPLRPDVGGNQLVDTSMDSEQPASVHRSPDRAVRRSEPSQLGVLDQRALLSGDLSDRGVWPGGRKDRFVVSTGAHMS